MTHSNNLTILPGSNFEKQLQEIKFLQNKFTDKKLTAKVLELTTLWQLAIDIKSTYENNIWLTRDGHEALDKLRLAMQKEYYNNKHFSKFQFFIEILNPEKTPESVSRATIHLHRHYAAFYRANPWLVDTSSILRKRPIWLNVRSNEHRTFSPVWKSKNSKVTYSLGQKTQY